MNNIFKKEDVEEVAAHRMDICKKCELYTMKGTECMVVGSQPCCSLPKGGCGCSLKFKTRSMSSECPHPDGAKWEAILTEEEEDVLNEKLGL